MPAYTTIDFDHTGGSPATAAVTLETAFRRAACRAGSATQQVFRAIDEVREIPTFLGLGGLSPEDRALYDDAVRHYRSALGGGYPPEMIPALRAVVQLITQWAAKVAHKAQNPKAVTALVAVAFIDAARDIETPEPASVDGLPWREDPNPRRVPKIPA